MTHAYHPGLPGYHPDQILHDGCRECEERGKDILRCMQILDDWNFHKAYTRALELDRGEAEHVSHAEESLLRIIGAFQHRIKDMRYRRW